MEPLSKSDGQVAPPEAQDQAQKYHDDDAVAGRFLEASRSLVQPDRVPKLRACT